MWKSAAKTGFKMYENGHEPLIAVCLQDICDGRQWVVEPTPKKADHTRKSS